MLQYRVRWYAGRVSNSLSFQPALTRPDLLAPAVRVALEKWAAAPWIDDVCAAEIDPQYAAGIDLCQHYGLDPKQAGNCLIISAKRAAIVRNAACVIPPGNRTDLGGLVRRFLNAREVSMMPREQAVAETQMEYGSITAVGLPNDWPVLIDHTLADASSLVTGSGVLHAKLRMPGRLLVMLTRGVVMESLSSKPKTT